MPVTRSDPERAPPQCALTFARTQPAEPGKGACSPSAAAGPPLADVRVGVVRTSAEVDSDCTSQ